MPGSTSEKRTVLVVEPSPTFGRKVASVCEQTGARVVLESALTDALCSIERQAPDAVIAARVLDALPGESLVAALRASPLHEHLAIAILSSDPTCHAQVAAARPDRIIARDASLGESIGAFLHDAFEAPDAATSIRELQTHNGEGRGALDARRVLVVDDMESTRRLLNLLLTRHGADVTLCEGGADAAQLINSVSDEPELVLMDYEMPGMNGEASLRALRDKGYTGPVLLCSGHDDPAFEQRALEYGFSGVVAKAEAHSELHTRCAQALRAAA